MLQIEPERCLMHAIYLFVSRLFNASLKINIRKAVTFGEVKFFIDKSNSLDRLLVKTNGSFTSELDWALENGDPNKIALDVGANAGYWAINMATSFSKVYAFEPNPQMFQKLQINVEKNRKDIQSRIVLSQVAVSDREEIVSFAIKSAIDGDFRNNTGLSHIAITEPTSTKSSINVSALTLDGLRLDGAVSLIKIDVEGFEHQVINGALGILERDQPRIVWEASLQLDRVRNTDNVKKCLELLDKLNYRHYILDEMHCLMEVNFSKLSILGADRDVISIHNSTQHCSGKSAS